MYTTWRKTKSSPVIRNIEKIKIGSKYTELTVDIDKIRKNRLLQFGCVELKANIQNG